MSSNYPEGSMKGSGIYASDYQGVFTCFQCEEDFEDMGVTNDWHTIAYTTCPKCNTEVELDITDDFEDARTDSWLEGLAELQMMEENNGRY